MEEKKVKVRILPLHNIGGIGNAGAEVWLTKAEAETYLVAGYVELVDAERADARPAPTVTPIEDHKVMKPQSKRLKK